VPHALLIESQRHAVAHRRRNGPRLLCGAIFVALLAFVAFGGSAPAAMNGSRLSVSRIGRGHGAVTSGLGAHRRAKPILQEGKPPPRGGKALTKEEFWRAQWRDEGAVFPGA
jgi:hypothetical protein